MAQHTPVRLCPSCHQYLPLERFYSEPRKGRCRECSRKKARERFQPARDYMDEYRMAHGCADCGYRENVRALQFDHRPGTNKLFCIGSSIANRTLDEIKAEIEKCEVVCANCHFIRTHERGNWGADWDLGRRYEMEDDFEPPFEQLRAFDDLEESA